MATRVVMPSLSSTPRATISVTCGSSKGSSAGTWSGAGGPGPAPQQRYASESGFHWNPRAAKPADRSAIVSPNSCRALATMY
eukprot:10206520-Lingulodinium_polyedra.AAC.1